MDHPLIYSWYEQYKDGIFRFAYSILKDVHLAEDVLQDTFWKLISGKGFPEPGKEQAWLYKVARNLCYDCLRRAKREQEEVKGVYCESQYDYITLISPLPPDDQQIVTLKIVGGLTHKEIGKVLGISARAAQKRYERAIAVLRSEEE